LGQINDNKIGIVASPISTQQYEVSAKTGWLGVVQYANYILHDLFLKQKTTHGQLFIVRSISDFSHISCA
jgi:hypothetical protein